MKVEIELRRGNRFADNVYKRDIQKNIDALTRAIEGKQRCCDDMLMIDTRSILEAIQKRLPDG